MKNLLLKIVFFFAATGPFLNAQGHILANGRSQTAPDNSQRKQEPRSDVFTIVYKPGPADSIAIAVTDLKKYVLQVIPGSTVFIKTKSRAEKLTDLFPVNWFIATFGENGVICSARCHHHSSPE